MARWTAPASSTAIAGANGAVQAVVCQTDGRVVIGGAFTNADGITRNHIARLMTDGSLDTSFNPGPAAEAPVYALAETFINGAREIYVGGAFNTISGGSSPNLARLIGGGLYINGGTLDAAFATGSGPNGPVYALAVYPTNSPFAGKLLIGGAFTNINGFALGHVARMNGDGSVDTNFDLNLGANDTVRAIAIQTDGRILIGGDFTNVNGTDLNHIARLNTDGSLDTISPPTWPSASMAPCRPLRCRPTIGLCWSASLPRPMASPAIVSPGCCRAGRWIHWINFGDGANGAIDALVIQPLRIKCWSLAAASRSMMISRPRILPGFMAGP